VLLTSAALLGPYSNQDTYFSLLVRFVNQILSAFVMFAKYFI